MIDPFPPDPYWIEETDWLCTVELLPTDDLEARCFAADVIGYLMGYAHLTNTRQLALQADPTDNAYEILFSFSCVEEKNRFLDFVRSNDDLGDSFVENDLLSPTAEEIRRARPVGKVLPEDVWRRATLIATSLCSTDANSYTN